MYVGCRCGLGPALLWFWRMPPATALIRPLAWDPPYAAGVALEKKDEKQTNKQTKNSFFTPIFLMITSERKIKKMIPFTVASKIIKCLEINLTK